MYVRRVLGLVYSDDGMMVETGKKQASIELSANFLKKEESSDPTLCMYHHISSHACIQAIYMTEQAAPVVPITHILVSKISMI